MRSLSFVEPAALQMYCDLIWPVQTRPRLCQPWSSCHCRPAPPASLKRQACRRNCHKDKCRAALVFDEDRAARRFSGEKFEEMRVDALRCVVLTTSPD